MLARGVLLPLLNPAFFGATDAGLRAMNPVIEWGVEHDFDAEDVTMAGTGMPPGRRRCPFCHPR